MTILYEQLSWITRPFDLTPPLQEDVFVECIDNLAMVVEARMSLSDTINRQAAELRQKYTGKREPARQDEVNWSPPEPAPPEPELEPEYDAEVVEDPDDLRQQAATAFQGRQSGHNDARDTLRRLDGWLTSIGEYFPKASKKLGKLQKQVARERVNTTAARPEKMLRALSAWGKDKMLPQLIARVDDMRDEQDTAQTFYDELSSILGVG